MMKMQDLLTYQQLRNYFEPRESDCDPAALIGKTSFHEL